MKKKDVGHEQANPISQMIWANTFLLILLAIPSLTLIVLLRRKPGYRTVQPWMLALGFLVMFMMGGASLLSGTVGGLGPGNYAMLIAAFAVLIAGVFWRWHAWVSLLRAERWHTKSRGVSYLAFLPFREYIIQRYIEPAICIALGMLAVAIFAPSLGIWLIFSGTFLGLYEGLIHEVQVNNILDQFDASIDAEVAGENDAFYRNGQNPPSIENSAGVSVGLAPELERAIAHRRASSQVATAQAAVTDQDAK